MDESALDEPPPPVSVFVLVESKELSRVLLAELFGGVELLSSVLLVELAGAVLLLMLPLHSVLGAEELESSEEPPPVGAWPVAQTGRYK